MKLTALSFTLCLPLFPASAFATEQPPACIAQWETQGEIMDVAEDLQGNILATDRINHRVYKYDEYGTLIEEWTGVVDPRGIAVDSQGFVYVGSWGSGAIHKFSPNGSPAGSWATPYAAYVAVDTNDDVWITSHFGDQVRKFDSAGNLLLEWPVGSVIRPRGIAVDSQGDVYVTEQGIADKIRKFDQYGNPIFTLSEIFAWDIAVDGSNNVFAARTGSVVKYSPDGILQTEWLGCDSGADNFEHLAGIGANRDGDVFVADFLGDRISVFASAARFSCAGFEPPMANYPVKAKKNRAFPLKMQLFDADGFEITDTGVTAAPLVEVMFTATGSQTAVDVTDDLLSVGQGTEGNQFVYTDADQWQFNLKSTNYTGAGTYVVTAVSGAPSEYVIDPSCVTSFEIQ